MPTSEQMVQAIRELPADARVDDAMERLYLLQNGVRGIAHADAGNTVAQEEARRRTTRWLA